MNALIAGGGLGNVDHHALAHALLERMQREGPLTGGVQGHSNQTRKHLRKFWLHSTVSKVSVETVGPMAYISATGPATDLWGMSPDAALTHQGILPPLYRAWLASRELSDIPPQWACTMTLTCSVNRFDADGHCIIDELCRAAEAYGVDLAGKVPTVDELAVSQSS